MTFIKSLFVFLGVTLRWIWKFFSTGVTVVGNLLYLALFILVLMILFYEPSVDIPENGALVVAPRGEVVEQPTLISPANHLIGRLTGAPLKEETLLQDIIDAITAAADDRRIKLLVLNTDRLQAISLDQIDAIGEALDYFKQSDKVVIAAGDQFNQGKYLLASWADEVYLNPMGSVDLRGFGVYLLYMQELLTKLDVDFNVFRAGRYKAAMEPFMRNDMSAEAQEANLLWLGNFWKEYSSRVASHRGLKPAAIDSAINDLSHLLAAAGGDRAKLALNLGLVDGLKSRQELENYLASIAGSDERKGFRQIGLEEYLTTLTPTYANQDIEGGLVGILVAKGNIVYGEGAVNRIGSDTLCKQIRAARLNNRIKALVLRLDTGGGSAFASELIRQELLQFQQSGKPVVISMGSMAASGGYWLAADADRIIASPMTLTGSIGVFGAMPTFENTLARLGIHGDGVGTTRFADLGNPTRTMSPEEQRLFQLDVEQAYDQFINLVAAGRKLSRQQVEEIAGGRVWDGGAAKRIGLVDELGTLDTAVAAAASLAGIPEENALYLQGTGTPLDAFLQRMEARVVAALPWRGQPFAGTLDLTSRIFSQFDFLLAGSDPAQVYAHCLLPSPPIAP